MNKIRGILRFTGFILWSSFSVMRLVLWSAVTRGVRRRKAVRTAFRQWAQLTIRMLGIRMEVQGDPPPTGTMLLPNHRSYIDVVAFPQVADLTFVAKIQVKSWPVIGAGAKAVNTVFVDRADKDSRRHTREEMARRLAEGRSVIVFTEGTTYKAPTLGELRPGMYYIAAEGGFSVVPVAIEYDDPDDAWVGADTFVPHFIRCFGKKQTGMKVRFGPEMHHEDGEILRQEVRQWLEESLRELGLQGA